MEQLLLILKTSSSSQLWFKFVDNDDDDEVVDVDSVLIFLSVESASLDCLRLDRNCPFSRNPLANGLLSILSCVIRSFWYAVTARKAVSGKTIELYDPCCGEVQETADGFEGCGMPPYWRLMKSLACTTWILATYLCILVKMMCPLWSKLLLVSLTFWNEMSDFIHWDPFEGESGCIKSLDGICGSAFPAIIHSVPLYLYRQSSDKIKSNINEIF